VYSVTRTPDPTTTSATRPRRGPESGAVRRRGSRRIKRDTRNEPARGPRERHTFWNTENSKPKHIRYRPIRSVAGNGQRDIRFKHQVTHDMTALSHQRCHVTEAPRCELNESHSTIWRGTVSSGNSPSDTSDTRLKSVPSSTYATSSWNSAPPRTRADASASRRLRSTSAAQRSGRLDLGFEGLVGNVHVLHRRWGGGRRDGCSKARSAHVLHPRRRRSPFALRCWSSVVAP
jgi:hypothetical protein